jgi:hypothetical protein
MRILVMNETRDADRGEVLDRTSIGPYGWPRGDQGLPGHLGDDRPRKSAPSAPGIR